MAIGNQESVPFYRRGILVVPGLGELLEPAPGKHRVLNSSARLALAGYILYKMYTEQVPVFSSWLPLYYIVISSIYRNGTIMGNPKQMHQGDPVLQAVYDMFLRPRETVTQKQVQNALEDQQKAH